MTGARPLYDAVRLFSIRGQPHGLSQRFLVGRVLRPRTEPRALIRALSCVACGVESGDDFQVVFWNEAPYGDLTLNHHGQRGSLHAPDRQLFAVCQGICAREVHPHQPVRSAAPPRGIS